MIYFNNQLVTNFEEYNLKNFTRDNYLGSSDSYYKEFFEIIKMTDEIIEQLFKNSIYDFSFVYSILSFEPNKDLEFKKFKIFVICNNVFNRMYHEHQIVPIIEIEDKFGCLNIKMTLTQKNQSVYNSNCNWSSDRQSGRTTKCANQCIELAYNNWTIENNTPVDIIDHMTFSMHFDDPRMRGRRISGMNQFNKHLFDKIRKRIDIEFPDEMIKFIRMTNNCDLLFMFPHNKKIDYNDIS